LFTYIFRLHKPDTVIEIITEEIKDPPGGDANDVPTEKFSEIIQRAVADII